MKKINQLKVGSILSYIQMGLSIVIGLVYTPVMIRLLGQSEYGLYQTVSSTIAMLGILNLGFNSSYVRYFAKYKKNNDYESISKLNGLFLIIFSVIALIAFLCGMFLTLHLELVFKSGLTAHEYSIARVLMFLLTINLAASFPLSVFTSIISANERFVFLKLVNAISTVLGPAVTLPLLLMGYRSIAMVTVSLVLSLLVGAINIYYVWIKLNNRFVFKGFEKGIFKSMFIYTLFIAINLIIDQINWNIDKILLGRFKGTTAVAVYSVGYTLYNCYMQFSTSISSLFTPRIHKIVNETKDDIEKQRIRLTELFVKVGRIQFLLLGLIASGIVFFGKEFILNIWMGKGYDDSYYVALLLIISASIALIQNLGIEIQRAQNLHHFRSYAYLVMAIINLVLSIILCQRYGAVGSAIGTAISLILANGLVMNIYYHKKCNIDVICFWKNILRQSFGLIIPCIFGIVYKKIVDCNKLQYFFLGIILYVVVYSASIWLISMNDYEKSLIISPLKRIIKK